MAERRRLDADLVIVSWSTIALGHALGGRVPKNRHERVVWVLYGCEQSRTSFRRIRTSAHRIDSLPILRCRWSSQKIQIEANCDVNPVARATADGVMPGGRSDSAVYYWDSYLTPTSAGFPMITLVRPFNHLPSK